MGELLIDKSNVQELSQGVLILSYLEVRLAVVSKIGEVFFDLCLPFFIQRRNVGRIGKEGRFLLFEALQS